MRLSHIQHSSDHWVPPGFAKIPGGTFQGQEVKTFAHKIYPVTNEEWNVWVRSQGQNLFIGLKHNSNTGETTVMKRGRDLTAVLENMTPLIKPNWDEGDVLSLGAIEVFKLIESPSAQYNEGERRFDRPKQPVVGVHWFGAWLFCKDHGWSLTTDLEYQYGASNKGKQEYGTSNGQLRGSDGQKLAHIGENNDSKGTTIDVDDKRNSLGPFGVQWTGNVLRWMDFNPEEASHYGLRADSWNYDEDVGRVAFRFLDNPNGRNFNVGFSPVRRQELP